MDAPPSHRGGLASIVLRRRRARNWEYSQVRLGVLRARIGGRMKRPRILLADDHVLVAQALEHLLQAEFDVVGTVADGRALLKAAGDLKPDVVVVDIGM